MSTRSVRLDDDAEAALNEIINHTGLSISAAIKEGLLEYRTKAIAISQRKPSAFFTTFDLGKGGYTLAAAKNSKSAIKNKLQHKQHRR